MKQFRLDQLAEMIGGRCEGPSDLVIQGVAGIREAKPSEISFLAHPRYEGYLATTQAAALICKPDQESVLPMIRVEDPYLAFLRAIQAFCTPVQSYFPEGVHESAVVDPSARLAPGVRVGAAAVIGRDCEIGEGSIVGPGAIVMDRARIGQHCLIYPNVVVREECILGDRVILQPGVVVGSDGFGFAKQDGSYHKIPQIGRVVVEDDVELGANTCIDRATTGQTVIGSGTKIDNLVQVAHNVLVGSHTVISSQTGISGSTEIGNDVLLAGQVGVVGHIRIGDGAKVGAQSGIAKDAPDGTEWFGSPATEMRVTKRLLAHYHRLPRYAKEIADLRRRLESLEKSQVAPPSANTEETS